MGVWESLTIGCKGRTASPRYTRPVQTAARRGTIIVDRVPRSRHIGDEVYISYTTNQAIRHVHCFVEEQQLSLGDTARAV